MSATPSARPELAHDVLGQARPNPLEAMFAPRHVAVIGATDKPGSVGLALMQNLQRFEGRLFPVNPKRKKVCGLDAFPSLTALPEKVDLAVIVTPAPSVPGLVHECAASGVPAAVIISAGFRECGEAGASLEQQCLAEARPAGLRLLGPNCLGLMMPHARLNATFARGPARPGNVAFLSQSGALCTSILDWSLRENVGFSAFVSVGSMLDVGWGDLISYFGDDPHTKSIVCYMESVGDARRFLSAAREVALAKPVIVLKVGHTEAAARAAASHTGALTGSDAVFDAALRRAGVLRVNSVAELFNLAEVLSKQPRPRGPRLGIVTNAGGAGALAADALVLGGAAVAELAPATLSALDDCLPALWSHRNPVDVLGDADPARYGQALERVRDDPGTDGTLVILTPQMMTDADGTASELVRLARPGGKPMLASWMGGEAVQAGRDLLNSAGVPTFDYPDTAARVFALMWRYSDALRALYETPMPLGESSAGEADRNAVSQRIRALRQAGRTLLNEAESKEILRAYGIPTVETHAALSEEEAVECAGRLGYPVAVKLLSATLTHKRQAGGVHLDRRDAAAVRQAWQAIRTAAGEHFLGVSVQPMIRHEGIELILGSSIDPQFGPVLLFGAGGSLVEVLQDTALGLPPLNATLARRLMERTRIFAALQGGRGGPNVNLDALSQVLVRFSQLVLEQPWITEIDINPLVVSPDAMPGSAPPGAKRGSGANLPTSFLALDARVALHPPGTAEAQLPRPAIRPYPAHHVHSWKLRDGSAAVVRPVRPEDEPLLVKFHRTLSERSVYLRYFAPLKLEERVAHERLSRLCCIDYDQEMALVAERRDPRSGELEILAVGRLSRWDSTKKSEFALTVSDQWQGQGLGTHLLNSLVQVARAERLERVTATILADNREMQQVARRAGFTVEHRHDSNECRATLVL